MSAGGAWYSSYELRWYSRLHAFPPVMSTRFADNGNAASHREDNLCEAAEAPLPTYDEVIGNDNPPNHVHVGFKDDVLLPPANPVDQGQSSADQPNRELHEGVRRFSSCKPNRTGTILVLLSMILIPMCVMIIILQVKVCATEQSQLQQSIDKINASYSECTAELSAFEDSQNTQENRIRDLNYQVQRLNEENKRLQGMLFRKNPNSIEE